MISINTDFELYISKQFWIGLEEEDVCSHGEIYLKVGGTIITQPGVNEQWGISESALALLRTLSKNYVSNPENEEGLIFHGCGTILMMGCPISIHWSVFHIEDQIILKDFIKVAVIDPKEGRIHYPGLQVTMTKKDYENIILTFALQAKNFFKNSNKKHINDTDKEMYQSFWNEYNELLHIHSEQKG
ncbi:hypothetical protein AB1K84_13500 [Mesobacillus foraminis]|uniref:hypothetical protein n=1 Tax=Mesobacillus foraminis TaxID=279826 RepID=UPI00399EF1BA